MNSDEDSNEATLRALAEAAELYDPVPDQWRDVGRASLTWLSIDEELAELVEDSAVGDPEAAGVRGVTPVRELTYTHGEAVISLELHQEAAALMLVGQLEPPGPVDVTIRQPGRASITMTADELGRFRVTGLADRPFDVHVPARSLWTGLIVPTDPRSWGDP
jgi:hypothetical protein